MTATIPSPLRDSLAGRLLRSSARHNYDPEVDLDWEADPVPGLWFMQPERMSLYGTPLGASHAGAAHRALPPRGRLHRERGPVVRDCADAAAVAGGLQARSA